MARTPHPSYARLIHLLSDETREILHLKYRVLGTSSRGEQCPVAIANRRSVIVDIVGNHRSHLAAHVSHTAFPPLAIDREARATQVHVVESKVGHFAYAEPGVEDQTTDHVIAVLGGAVLVEGIKQPMGLFAGQRLDLCLGDPGILHQPHGVIVFFDNPIHNQERIERPENPHVSLCRAG